MTGDEARYVAQEIARLVDSGEVSYPDVAIFYRANAQSRVLEEALFRQGCRTAPFWGHPVLRPA